jgi:hypothetical protein
MIQAQVKGLQLTMRNLQMLEREGVRSMARMIRGVTIQAGLSASKLSPPAVNKSYKRLPVRNKKRKVVTIGAKGVRALGGSVSVNKKYWYVKRNNVMFSTEKKLSPKERNKRGYRQVTKAVRYWDKKTNQWALAPINPNTGKPPKAWLRTGLKIPAAGALKAGWLHGMRQIGAKTDSTPSVRSKLGVGVVTPSKASLINIVNYGTKIAAHVPAQAKQRAWKWLKSDLWRKEKRKLEKIHL